MKTIYFLLLVSLNSLANISVNENHPIQILNEEIKQSITPADSKPTNNSIAGLKIVSHDSQKFGKHIYVVSDMYTKKKITFYNAKGRRVYSKSTIGSPIHLSKFKKGTYKVKVMEGKKTEITDLVVN